MAVVLCGPLWLANVRAQEAPRPDSKTGTPAVSQAAQTRGGAVKTSPKDALNYVWIPPGSFVMGCSPEDRECSANMKLAHQVTISRGLWIGQTPVTVGAYKRFARATGRSMPPEPEL
jgi:formylglycine-generating enzyme required for sulfatase activity